MNIKHITLPRFVSVVAGSCGKAARLLFAGHRPYAARPIVGVALALIGALLLAGCSSVDATVPVVPEGAQAGDLIGWDTCRYQPADSKTIYDAECGTLIVPENWSNPDSRHITDVMETLQPEAFERLVTSYYDSGVADDSLYVYQPLSFEPSIRLSFLAWLMVAVIILFPALLILGLVLGVVLGVRRFRRRRTGLS